MFGRPPGYQVTALQSGCVSHWPAVRSVNPNGDTLSTVTSSVPGIPCCKVPRKLELFDKDNSTLTLPSRTSCATRSTVADTVPNSVREILRASRRQVRPRVCGRMRPTADTARLPGGDRKAPPNPAVRLRWPRHPLSSWRPRRSDRRPAHVCAAARSHKSVATSPRAALPSAASRVAISPCRRAMRTSRSRSRAA